MRSTTMAPLIVAALLTVGFLQLTTHAQDRGRGRGRNGRDMMQQAGIDPGVVRQMRQFLVDAGLDEEQVEAIVRIIPRVAHAAREHGANDEVAARVKGHLAQRHGLDGDQLKTAMEIIGKIQWMAANGGDRKDKEGMHTNGPILVYVDVEAPEFDADGSITVEEEELEKGFLSVLEQANEGHALLLKQFDANRDGALDEAESSTARRAVFGLAAALLYDTDGNWLIDDAESDTAWAGLAEETQRHNEQVLRKLDRNGDGEIGPDEKPKARGTKKD